jgi:hypothetical protein
LHFSSHAFLARAAFARVFEARAQVLESQPSSRDRETFLRGIARASVSPAQRFARFESQALEAHDSSCESSCSVI